jgi:hypothetical protein
MLRFSKVLYRRLQTITYRCYGNVEFFVYRFNCSFHYLFWISQENSYFICGLNENSLLSVKSAGIRNALLPQILLYKREFVFFL